MIQLFMKTVYEVYGETIRCGWNAYIPVEEINT